MLIVRPAVIPTVAYTLSRAADAVEATSPKAETTVSDYR
jgi:hypothetical protein